jgi:hypothetical protein
MAEKQKKNREKAEKQKSRKRKKSSETKAAHQTAGKNLRIPPKKTSSNNSLNKYNSLNKWPSIIIRPETGHSDVAPRKLGT